MYGCFSFCFLACNSNILFNRTNIFRDKTSFRQFLTWLLPGLKKMLILIISNTEGVKVLVCPAIFLDIRWVSGINLPMFTYGRCCCHFLWLMLLPLFDLGRCYCHVWLMLLPYFCILMAQIVPFSSDQEEAMLETGKSLSYL